MFLEIGHHTINYSVWILIFLGALGFDEFTSQVYRVKCTEHISTGFVGGACFN